MVSRTRPEQRTINLNRTYFTTGMTVFPLSTSIDFNNFFVLAFHSVPMRFRFPLTFKPDIVQWSVGRYIKKPRIVLPNYRFQPIPCAKINTDWQLIFCFEKREYISIIPFAKKKKTNVVTIKETFTFQ